MSRPRLNEIYPPIVSVTGIDGAGKSSVARSAQLQLSQHDVNFASLEADRQLHLIQAGQAWRLFNDHYDATADLIDGGRRLGRTVKRLAYTRAKAELERTGQVTAAAKLDLLVNVRDPILDAYVFTRGRLPCISPAFSLQALKRVTKARWPDTTVWLDIEPEIALARIGAAQEQRHSYGEQDHEDLVTLRQMRASYSLATTALQALSGQRVVRLDASRPIEEVSANLVDVLSDSRRLTAQPVYVPTRPTTV